MERFVGRAIQLDLIASAVSAEGSRAVLITGDPGSGKSRLLAEACATLGKRRVMALRGYEPEALAPLAAASDLIRDLALEHPALAKLLDADQLLTDVTRVFEEVQQAVVAESRPVVITVDDLQWLDSSTLALLHYVVRGSRDRGRDVLLVIAARPCAEVAALHDALISLLGSPAVHATQLAPLDRAAGATLVRDIDQSITAEVAEQYWVTANGSPFWLRMLAQDESRSTSTSLVQARLRACSVDAAMLASALGVAARPLSVRAAAEVLGWSSAQVEAAVESLVHRGLAHQRYDMVSLVHDLVRSAVVADLPADVRRNLHRSVAGWLERSNELSALIGAVQHRVNAGDAVGDLVGRITTSPQRGLMDMTGVRELAAIVEHAAGPEIDVLLPALAQLATDFGEPELSLPLWERVVDLAPDLKTQAIAAREAARSKYQSGDGAAALRWLERARALAQGDPALIVRVEALESHVLRWSESKFDQAAAASRRAVSAARELGASPSPDMLPVVVEALEVGMEDALVRGDLDQVVVYADEMDALARGHPDLTYTVATYRVLTFMATGDFPGAERIARRHWRAAVHAGHTSRVLETAGQLLEALTEQGKLAEAQMISDQVEPLVGRSRELARRFTVGMDLTSVSAAVQEVRALTADWRVAVGRIVDETPRTTPHFAIRSLQCAAALTARLGSGSDADTAADLCDRTISAAETVGCRRCRQEARLTTSITHSVLGNTTAARILLDTSQEEATSDPPRIVRRWQTWAAALVMAAEGDRRPATRYLEDLRADYESTGELLSALWISTDLAALTGDDQEETLSALEEASRRSCAIGASNVTAAVARRMRELGVRTWRRGSATGGELSEREQEIARLLTTGASNPEIAATVFLSRKTVERHVSNILAKYDVRNRAELAAVLARASSAPTVDRNEGDPS